MITILENISLKKYNTFGVEASCRWFAEINSVDDLLELFSDPFWKTVDRLVLGGGSNVLFTHDFEGLVLKINIRGLEFRKEGEQVFVTAGAGEVWNDLVQYCVNQDFAGLENLSLIPGSVGASPIQNIGAYGVEVKDVFHSCETFEPETGRTRTFNHSDCYFAYRDSIFKTELKGKYIITRVTFCLSLHADLNTSYGAIAAELQKRGISEPSIRDISSVVSHIRVEKLPDPSTIGNAGSFFKNPVVPVGKFRQLQSAFPDIVHFSVDSGMEKIAAGWMLEQAGWKGKVIDSAGTWKNQALVLVNTGNAKGSDIYDLSSLIISDIEKQFGITLEREVNIF